PVADRVVVRVDRRVTLRVVADVDEKLRRRLGDVNPVEELARAASLLHDGGVADARSTVRVSDGVGAPFGDPCEQRLGSQRPWNGRIRAQAVTSDSTHQQEMLGRSPDTSTLSAHPFWRL